MKETASDLERLQTLLNVSYEAAGPHLREVISPDRRLTAAEVCHALTGMRLLVLSTVTKDNRPIGGPVDGVFYRGAFHFGSAPNSTRFAHIRARPSVTATHLPGEELSVTVHGRAHLVDVAAPDQAGFRQTLLDIYVPRYGSEWETFLDSGPIYARIEAERMFTFHMSSSPPGARPESQDS